MTADIDDNDLSFTLSPAGIGNTGYPASGTGAIGGKEVVTFTRVADVVTIVRAQFNTEAVAHKAGDRFQLCLVYDAEDPADVIADLFENYASIPSSAIPLASWQAETAAYYRRLVSACIAVASVSICPMAVRYGLTRAMARELPRLGFVTGPFSTTSREHRS